MTSAGRVPGFVFRGFRGDRIEQRLDFGHRIDTDAGPNLDFIAAVNQSLAERNAPQDSGYLLQARQFELARNA